MARPPARVNPWLWLTLLAVAIAGALVALVVLERDEERAAPTTTTTVAPPTVPSVVGASLTEGFTILRAAGYQAAVEEEASAQPRGQILYQQPEGGTELERGELVFVTVSAGGGGATGAPRRQATVPDVVGRTQLAAGAQLERLGFPADSYPVPSDEPPGTVVEQDPDGGARLALGETVRLNVSRGRGAPPLGNIPDVTGPRASVARARIRRARYTVRTVERPAPSPEEVGEVILQEPNSGDAIRLWSQMTIYVGS